MRSAALALSWQIWWRHRLGLAAVAAALLAFAAVVCALPTGTFGPIHGHLWSYLFVFGLGYVATAFAYGFDSPLEQRGSGFPGRQLLLPVRTAALVAWPMLQGTAAVALLWAGWAWFVLRPVGVEVSVAR